MTRKLAEFYNGKTIFMTGASGYLGVILLEILLRCFPGIKCIYLLLRSKKNINPQERKKQIMDSVVMKHMRNNCSEVFKKVHIVAGELGKVDFGISEEDLSKLIDEVEIVFHLAAVVSFSNTYRSASIKNSKGTLYALDFCKKLQKLEALIYTGTAFSNMQVAPQEVEEKIYELPYPAQRFLDELDNGTEESFDKLIDPLPMKLPNSYIFSKLLAEDVIREFSENLPVVIVRPSIIIQPWKGPAKGYLTDGLGFQNATYGITRGIIRLIPAMHDSILDMIPADIVANSHIIAAWGIATGRLPRLHVINCIGGDTCLRTYYRDYLKDILDLAHRCQPIPNGLRKASAKCVENETLFRLLRFYEEYLPCFVLDMCLIFAGKEPKFVKMQTRYFVLLHLVGPFLRVNVEFRTENFKALDKLLEPGEREMIYTEIKDVTIKEISELSVQNSTLYDPSTDTLSPKERRKFILKYTILFSVIRYMVIAFLCLISYCIYCTY